MPSWWIGLPKKTRSPGWRSPSDTRLVASYWAEAEWGSEWPACPQLHIVRPEQSKLSGPAAPYSYGLPIWRRASSTAPDASFETGGSGPPDDRRPDRSEPATRAGRAVPAARA